MSSSFMNVNVEETLNSFAHRDSRARIGGGVGRVVHAENTRAPIGEVIIVAHRVGGVVGVVVTAGRRKREAVLTEVGGRWRRLTGSRRHVVGGNVRNGLDIDADGWR